MYTVPQGFILVLSLIIIYIYDLLIKKGIKLACNVEKNLHSASAFSKIW